MYKVILSLLILSMPFLLGAQTYDGFTKGISKSGKVKVMSRVLRKTNEKGEKIQVAEYTTETIAVMNFDKAVAIMKNVELHPKFMTDTEISKRIKTISENEWIIYYAFDSPWPLPNSDCVIKMNYSLSADGKTATFSGVSNPSLYAIQEVIRMNYFTVVYTFENMGSGRVKYTVETKATPVTTVPDWVVNTWFPEGPAETVENFIRLVNDSK
jgi:hypothetical protein